MSAFRGKADGNQRPSERPLIAINGPSPDQRHHSYEEPYKIDHLGFANENMVADPFKWPFCTDRLGMNCRDEPEALHNGDDLVMLRKVCVEFD